MTVINCDEISKRTCERIVLHILSAEPPKSASGLWVLNVLISDALLTSIIISEEPSLLVMAFYGIF